MNPKQRQCITFAVWCAVAMLALGLLLRYVPGLSGSLADECYGALTLPAYFVGTLLSHNVHHPMEAAYWLFAAAEWFLIAFVSFQIFRGRGANEGL